MAMGWTRSGWARVEDSCKERGWRICHVVTAMVVALAVLVIDAVVDKGLKAEIEVVNWS